MSPELSPKFSFDINTYTKYTFAYIHMNTHTQPVLTSQNFYFSNVSCLKTNPDLPPQNLPSD